MNKRTKVVVVTMMEPKTIMKKDKKYAAIDWWIGTVILAFFPIIISFIIHCVTGKLNFSRLIGDGELILSAFGVSAPMLISHFNKTKEENKIYYYFILLISFFQLVTYTAIKTNDQNITNVVYITSGICVISSILLAWALNKKTMEG